MPAIVALKVDLHVRGTAFSLPGDARRTGSGQFAFARGSVALRITRGGASVPPRITLAGREARGRRILIPGARTAKLYRVGHVAAIRAAAHHRRYQFTVATTRRPDPSLTDRIVDTFRIVRG
jgi:hypothetical protein